VTPQSNLKPQANKADNVLRIAIVGHTNTGKTSLVRTLLRDEKFGEIADAAGTTRSVERIAIYAGDEEVLSLYDTPGLEDSSALLQALDDFSATMPGVSPGELMRKYVVQGEGQSEFDQENKVLLQALGSDVLLYIIDVREPLLGKYRDEVSILSKCGKPIIPVFNFIAGHEEALARWREQMAEFNLHAALEFDTVAFDFEAEKRLYQKLQSVHEPHYEALQSLIDYRQDIWQNLSRAAAQRIFDLLRDVTGYRRVLETASDADLADAEAQMRGFVRKAEQRALKDLLTIFSFNQVDVELQQLPVEDGRWELDVFSPAALKAFGLNASSSALTGAAAGAGVDLMVGGLSLGVATVIGAALGAGVATARRYKQEIKAAWRGNKWLCVDDNTVALLYLRQRELLQRLTRRGHAAQGKMEIVDGSDNTLPNGWSRILEEIRQHPEWQQGASGNAEYERVKSTLIGWLLTET
jgi:hypothetical protein